MALQQGAVANFSPHGMHLVWSSKTLPLPDRFLFEKPVVTLFSEYCVGSVKLSVWDMKCFNVLLLVLLQS